MMEYKLTLVKCVVSKWEYYFFFVNFYHPIHLHTLLTFHCQAKNLNFEPEREGRTLRVLNFSLVTVLQISCWGDDVFRGCARKGCRKWEENLTDYVT